MHTCSMLYIYIYIYDNIGYTHAYACVHVRSDFFYTCLKHSIQKCIQTHVFRVVYAYMNTNIHTMASRFKRHALESANDENAPSVLKRRI